MLLVHIIIDKHHSQCQVLHDLLRLADAAHVDALRAHAHAHEPVLFEVALPHRLRNGARVQAVPCSTVGRGAREWFLPSEAATSNPM